MRGSNVRSTRHWRAIRPANAANGRQPRQIRRAEGGRLGDGGAPTGTPSTSA
ncbi:MAG: hypothetical protein U0703_08610 [Anaerolineae bacterium]